MHFPRDQPVGSQLKEFGHGFQIPIGIVHMDVPQIGGQLGEFSFDIEPGAIPVDQGAGGKSVALMPISALATACRIPDYAESLSNTSAGGARTVFSFGIIRALPGRPTVCHPAGNVLA